MRTISLVILKADFLSAETTCKHVLTKAINHTGTYSQYVNENFYFKKVCVNVSCVT